MQKFDPEKATVKQVVNVAVNVRRLRKEKGLSQLHLAMELNCSESFISGVECSRYCDISLLFLNKLSHTLGVGIDDLLNIPPEEKKIL